MRMFSFLFKERSDERIWYVSLLLKGNRSWCAFWPRGDASSFPNFPLHVLCVCFWFFGGFSFCFVFVFGNSHTGHKNRNKDSEFKNLWWGRCSRDNRFFFTCSPSSPPPPQFRSGHAFDTCTQREFGALADELVCSRLGFRILLSVSALRAGTSTRSTPRLSVLLFLPPSPPPFDAVPRSRERGEGPRVCYLHLSDEKLGRL